MIVVEHQGIELDYCPNCDGVWFDTSELDLFLDSAGLERSEFSLDDLLQNPTLNPTHKGRKCPICNRGLKEVAICDATINIDVCDLGDGYWFDGGEVHGLLKYLAQKSCSGENQPQKVIDFIGNVFQAENEGKES
jgi:Zn-finger nucleic acid-binding protein